MKWPFLRKGLSRWTIAQQLVALLAQASRGDYRRIAPGACRSVSACRVSQPLCEHALSPRGQSLHRQRARVQLMHAVETLGFDANRCHSLRTGIAVLLCALSLLGPQASFGEPGVTSTTIRIGGVMDLEGRSRGLGQGMKVGIEAALRGQEVRGRRLEFITLNDSYTPTKTVEATNELIRRGVFVVMGNVGTPTAKVSLPILADHGVPAVGFFTGAGLLRPGVGDVVNYRASYVQETASVIESAIKAGIPPSGICAYVQNDAYGMAGVVGIRKAIAGLAGTQKIVDAIDKILSLEGSDPRRNNIGPVGVYKRNTFVSRDGYESLKNWEQATGARCRLVVSVGTYNAIARFVAFARYKGDDWIVSAVSFTGADNFRATLKDFHVSDRIVMTQVVPALSSKTPIVVEARKALGEQFGYVSLEGYIVGKMFLKTMRNIDGEITRDKFLRAVRGRKFELAGLTLDFSDDNQGSDLVLLTYLKADEFHPMTTNAWRDMVQK